MPTAIMFHGCQHEFQDKEHGRNKRVFNKCASNANTNKWRCTVCGEVAETEKKEKDDV